MLHIFQIYVQTQIGPVTGQVGVLVTRTGTDG